MLKPSRQNFAPDSKKSLTKMAYETEENFPKAVKMFSCLALLPKDEVIEAFKDLKEISAGKV